MRKRLENNNKTKKYLESLSKIYLVGFWADYGVREHYFSGKFNKQFIPLVYDYDDHNGTTDAYYLRPLDFTTTGAVICWTYSKQTAEWIAKALRKSNKS